ncbi:hypothetical protein Nocox_07505 [Nonomuraea coxensis DSM 45129]|uniref:Metallopeptidase DUF4344 n=1 Tax=Nonomuraea coxensis DSM 45129 TaxID=1122611 RepID=A0ABX8TUJ0_9ACTN|nr:DUF4344 domain-containing metallopeptidase [Nonomuraea coxensis]QYC39126.1 hypothetical protein Nocox_07505 [Nonomuraea coxensis DSM 45129]
MPHPLAALALSMASALGAAPTPSPPAASPPAVRFEPAGSERAEQARRLLKESDALRTKIRLPRAVEVVARDCDGRSAAWDAQESRITICYSMVDRMDRTLTGISETEEADARAADRRLDAALTAFFHHELGHALGTLGGLEDPEGQADTLAALTLAADRPGQAVPAAEARHLLAAGHAGLGHLAGEEESATFACLLYGADPAANAAIAKGGWVPAERAPSCAGEYQEARAAAGPLISRSP